MENRPHLKVPLSQNDKILESVGWAMFIALWLFSVATYFTLPATIPTHFNGAGQPDGHGSKATYFLLAAIGSVLFLGITKLNNYPWVFNYMNLTSENTLQQYTYATKMIRSLKTTIIFLFLLINVLTWLTAMGKITGIGSWFLPFLLLLFLVPTGYYMVKALSKPKAR